MKTDFYKSVPFAERFFVKLNCVAGKRAANCVKLLLVEQAERYGEDRIAQAPCRRDVFVFSLFLPRLGDGKDFCLCRLGRQC